MNLETGEPMDDLTELAKEWCKQHGAEINTVSEFLEKKDEKLMKAIQDGIDRYNSRAISRAQKVCNAPPPPTHTRLDTPHLIPPK